MTADSDSSPQIPCILCGFVSKSPKNSLVGPLLCKKSGGKNATYHRFFRKKKKKTCACPAGCCCFGRVCCWRRSWLAPPRPPRARATVSTPRALYRPHKAAAPAAASISRPVCFAESGKFRAPCYHSNPVTQALPMTAPTSRWWTSTALPPTAHSPQPPGAGVGILIGVVTQRPLFFFFGRPPKKAVYASLVRRALHKAAHMPAPDVQRPVGRLPGILDAGLQFRRRPGLGFVHLLPPRHVRQLAHMQRR